jgi:hypothetical protein
MLRKAEEEDMAMADRYAGLWERAIERMRAEVRAGAQPQPRGRNSFQHSPAVRRRS